MIGITISSDQIRNAPADVRKWIEGEVTAALGPKAPVSSTEQKGKALAICSVEELGTVLSLLKSVLPAVNVLFELGHQGVRCADGQLEAYRMMDLLSRTRLRDVEQVVICLDMINKAVQSVRGTADVSFYGLDGNGHCFVASQTQQNISELWARVIAGDEVRSQSALSPAIVGEGQDTELDEHPIAAAPAAVSN